MEGGAANGEIRSELVVVVQAVLKSLDEKI